jgi:diguanylate cyclase (GGDEF)-like protein/PAS domain S-box-containing protein
LIEKVTKFKWMPKLWTKVVLSVALVQIPLFILATFLYIQEVRNDYIETVGWHSLTLSQQLQKRAANLSGYTPEMQRTLGLNIDSQSLLNDNIAEGVVHVGVIGLDGKTIASTDSSRLDKIEFENEVKNIYDEPAPLTFIAANYYETLIPVYNAERSSPVAVIYIGFSRQAVVLKIINTITYASVLYFIFLLLSSILISILLRRFVTQPISELSKAATNLANGNLTTHIPKASSYEVGLLADSFANMSNSIAETLDSIKESEERFSLAMQGANDGLWDWDLNTDEVYYSPRWKSMLGYAEDEIKPHLSEWKRLVHVDDMNRALSEFEASNTSTKDKFETEFRMQHKDGQYLDILSRAFAVKNEKGVINRLVGTHVDITTLKQTADALINSEDRFRTVSKLSNDILWEWHLDEDTLNWFGNIDEQLGYEENEFPRTIDAWRKIIHPEDLDHVENTLNKALEEQIAWYEEYRVITKDGKIQYWVDRGEVRTEKDGKPIIMAGAITDITERKHADEQISYQASHDALTGLINRREFENRAERLLSKIRQDESEHALCFMDLDQFKVVNDTCGHAAGDEMLRQLSTVLQETVRDRDTLARLGGDEFGILMEHCSLDDAHRVATTLQKAIQNYQFAWEGHSFKVGVSMGLVPITQTTTNLTELLRDADAACYMAKDKGRNRIHVYRTDDSEIARRHGEMQWVTRIQHALEENRFCLYAQSIVPLDNNTDKHYELLIRMIDEKGKTIPPGAFLPAAERYNLITQLDRWVVESAFRLLENEPAFQSQISFISINLSGQSLAEKILLDLIITRLDETGIEGQKICFEITETAAISNLGSAIKFISTLKGLGCRFALDDFGSGLSSFAYLKNLPVDYLKIDGMFVKDIVDDPIDHAMVKSINEVGHVMGMKTIAEFVENDEIKGMLREIGVNYAQGYGIDKPRPLDDLLGRSTNVTE